MPGRDGEPLISPHLKTLRPFLRKGDFAPGGLGPRARRRARALRLPDREDRLFGLLHDAARMGAAQGGVDRLIVAGIVTNGGVASTVRDAHVRDFETIVLEDGCAAFDRANPRDRDRRAEIRRAHRDRSPKFLNEVARMTIKAPPAAFETPRGSGHRRRRRGRALRGARGDARRARRSC